LGSSTADGLTPALGVLTIALNAAVGVSVGVAAAAPGAKLSAGCAGVTFGAGVDERRVVGVDLKLLAGGDVAELAGGLQYSLWFPLLSVTTCV
jgi:hypothetical protein